MNTYKWLLKREFWEHKGGFFWTPAVVGALMTLGTAASVIAGLAITQLLQCVAGMVQHPQRHKVYWVHLVWVLYAFEYVALWWWYEYSFVKMGQWSFGLYLFILIYAVAIYLMCAILAPLSLHNFEDYEAYYYSRRRWFLALAALVIVIDIADTFLVGRRERRNRRRGESPCARQ